MERLGPRTSSGRQRLSKVLRAAGDLLGVADVAKALDIPRVDASKILARWVRQGYMSRIRRGLFAPIPLESAAGVPNLSNPWVLVPELFDPCYVGGWSAAEYWDLTEQLFQTVCVLTAAPVRRQHQTIHGIGFRLSHIGREYLFGTRVVWEGKTKILVSDPHRTILDMLDDPAVGGGIRHVQHCLSAYLESGKSDIPRLIEYGDRLGNGAVFKRLGYLLDRTEGTDREILRACSVRRTAGNAKLDPSLPGPRLVTKWRLWVPTSWKE